MFIEQILCAHTAQVPRLPQPLTHLPGGHDYYPHFTDKKMRHGVRGVK